MALSPFFASHMVLQRDSPMVVYGTAALHERVDASLNGGTASTTAGDNGQWSLSLPPQPAGGPCTLNIAGAANTIALTDVLIGDVWLASGQSNMLAPMKPSGGFTRGVLDCDNEVNAANYPQLRYFATTRQFPTAELPQIAGSWTVCSPDTAGNYSAVAYYFARKIQAQTGVPIGIVVSAVVATSITCWMDVPTAQSVGFATGIAGQYAPGNCFNGMIAPLVSVPMKGFIWYQGEADTCTASTYAASLRTLIADWRGRWHNPNMPFYFVQIANYDPTLVSPPGASHNGSWGKLRLAQAAALDYPLTGMATAADVGEPAYIHPQNKKPVGERLATVALNATYGQAMVCTGPAYTGKTVDGGSAIISYDPASIGSGLVIKAGAMLTGFDLAGADGVFYPAQAVISGNNVILTCPSVPAPQDARYGWGNNPVLTLYNADGFPATPFLTTPVPADSNCYPINDPSTAGQDDTEGHWHFDGNGSDTSGTGRNLVLVNNPSFSTTDCKEGAGSIAFDGASQYGFTSACDVGSRFTITGWVKVAAGVAGSQTIIGNSCGGSAGGFRFYVNSPQTSDGALVFETSNGSAVLRAATRFGTITPGTWQFLAVSVDAASGTARISVNGMDKTAVTAARTDFATSGPLLVACSGVGVDYFKGSLDDLQILPGALTAAQSGTLAIGGLLARWSFELSGNESVSHNRLLSLVNGTTYGADIAPVGAHSAVFSGAGQFLDAGSRSLGSAYTISLWVKIPHGVSGSQTLLANSAGGTSSGFQFLVNAGAAGNGQLVLATGNGKYTSKVSSAGNVFEPDQWNHVAVTVDHTRGVARLYYRGTQLPVNGAFRVDAQTTGTLLLGALPGGTSALTGNLDDVRVYNRVLAVNEIAALAAATGNLAPVARPTTATVSSGANEVLDIVTHALDPDRGPQALRIVRTSSPAGGTVAISGGKVIYTPAPGYAGSDRFTYTVSDGLSTSSAEVTVKVASSFGGFRDKYFTLAQRNNPAMSAPGATPGGNGITNLMAYAFGLNPLRPDFSKLPATRLAGQYLETTFTRLNDAPDVHYVVEVSDDLTTWRSGDDVTTEISAMPVDSARVQVTVRDRSQVTGSFRRFMRVRVSE